MYETRDPGHLNKLLTEEATELFKEYTGSKGASTLVNSLFDPLRNPKYRHQTKQTAGNRSYLSYEPVGICKKVESLCGVANTKMARKSVQSGLAFTIRDLYGTCYSSLHLSHQMAFKKCFYIPSFITTCIDPDSLDFEVWDDAKCDLRKNFHNVLLEIDTSAYPNFSTILQPSQSDRYYACKESLISCYNIFEWVGYKLVKIWVDLDSENERQIEVPMVSLRISDYENVNDLENHRVKGPSSPIPEEWILGRAAALKSRETGPSQLNKNFQDLIGSYARNGGKQYPLDWLKANFSGSEEIRQQGLELDGPLFADLVKKQEEMRETGSKPQ